MFSRAAGREGRCRQISLACVGSTRGFPATLGLPPLGAGVCAFLVYIAQAPRCSPGSGPCVAWTSQAYAAQIQVFGYSTEAQTPLGLRFVPSPFRAAQAARRWRSALSPGARRLFPSAVPASVSVRAGRVRLVSVLGSWTLAVTLQRMLTSQNLRRSLVRSWKPVCSVVGDAVSGAEFAPFPSPLPPAGDGPVHSRLALLWYSVSPSFLETGR